MPHLPESLSTDRSHVRAGKSDELFPAARAVRRKRPAQLSLIRRGVRGVCASASRTRWRLSDDKGDLFDGFNDERVADAGPLAAARLPSLATKLHPAFRQTGRDGRDRQADQRLATNRRRHRLAVTEKKQLLRDLPQERATNQKLAPWCRHDKDGKENRADENEQAFGSVTSVERQVRLDRKSVV